MSSKYRPTLAIALFVLTVADAVPRAQHTRLFRPEDLSELEQPDRDEWQRPDKIMDALGIGEASVVADLGAGSGWFTIKLAGRVGPNGMVYAEDIQRPMIQAIKIRVDPEAVIRDAQKAGLVLRSRETFLKYQYLLVFEKPRS